MSFVLQITDRIRETSGMLAGAERRVTEQPDDLAALLDLKSLDKHRDELDAQFAEATRLAGVDVCAYRLFGTGSQQAMSVFQALESFQRLFTLTYRAIVHGAKQTAAIADADRAATYFGFSHTFAGSVGVMLTLPNERLLFNESELDTAIGTVFEMTRLQSSDSIRRYAVELGLPVIRELHKWGRAHTSSHCGADIDWRRGDVVRKSVFVQSEQIEELATAIESTSDEEVEDLSVTGILVGADENPARFHFRTDDGVDLRGKFFDAISGDRELALFRRYRALIRRVSVRHYSTDQEDETYFLESLAPAR